MLLNLLTSANWYFSIVPMMTALQNLQILGMDHFVLYMRACMELNAGCMVAVPKRLLAHKHVKDIKVNGIGMFEDIIGILCLELEEC